METKPTMDQNDFSKDEIVELYTKVHEHIEGRYTLDGADLHNIHAALVQLANLQ